MIRLSRDTDADRLRAKTEEAYKAPVEPRVAQEEKGVSLIDDTREAICVMNYYRIPESMWDVLSFNLRKSDGWVSQVTDFYPLSASDETKTAPLVPLLASALKALLTKVPEAGPHPVFARFENMTPAEATLLVGQMKRMFPNAGTAGNAIWMDTLQGAYDAVSRLAVNV